MLDLDYEQSDAVYMLTNCRTGVVTGGPGRGKTRCLQAALPALGKSVALCAPSGKAARRMAELTQHPASTVHRLLGLQPGSSRPTHHRGNPLAVDCVVVDEASTLDSFVCSKLLNACDPERTRVHFIGDADQLPSVGAGQVLLDLILSDRLPVVRLKTVHRAAAHSWVCTQGPEILEGRIDLAERQDFQLVEVDAHGLIKRTCEVVKQLVGKYGRDAVQTMVPMNVGSYGCKVFNLALQPVLNAASIGGPWFSGAGQKIYPGDDVVVIENDYEQGVFNGETGRIVEIESRRDGDVVVDFGDREIRYKRDAATDLLRLSYALTVHKMQGSEVPWVVLVLSDAHGPMLTRKLLYTAVTRAKTGVVIVGQRDAVLRAVATADSNLRQTALRERLLGPQQ